MLLSDGIMMTPRRRVAFRIIGPAVAFALPLTQARTQSAPDKPKTRPWRISSTVEVTTLYDNNVYRLPDNKLDDLASPSASSLMSGRYIEMESSGDLVTMLRAATELTGPGIAGRRVTLGPRVEYDAYARNGKRRNLTLSLGIEQAFRHDGRLRLRARMMPGYFAKNYLTDALDRNGDGSIASNERIYAPGTYTEQELSLDYQFRVAKSTKARPFGAALRLGAGYYGRTYDGPFAGRDISGPTVKLSLPVDLTRRLSTEVSYERVQLSATPTRSVLLIDEPQFQRDFNGNGRTSDLSARAFEMIDRSRTESSVDLESRYELTRRVDLRFDFDRRSRTYESTEPYDIANNGRRDWRNEFGLEMDWNMAHGLHVIAAGRTSAQTLNRENDPGAAGEVDDYHRKQFSLGLTRRF